MSSHRKRQQNTLFTKCAILWVTKPSSKELYTKLVMLKLTYISLSDFVSVTRNFKHGTLTNVDVYEERQDVTIMEAVWSRTCRNNSIVHYGCKPEISALDNHVTRFFVHFIYFFI